jgi:aspartyl-tRNA(Asn)/glutamyl-tRNA(Gln) amidotransferase subunit A
MYANDVCTVTVNIAGLPAISIPCAYDDKGLPVGMQLIGGKFTEQRLLNTAYAYEQLVGGFKMPEL